MIGIYSANNLQGLLFLQRLLKFASGRFWLHLRILISGQLIN
jgi:hypothetical protein